MGLKDFTSILLMETDNNSDSEDDGAGRRDWSFRNLLLARMQLYSITLKLVEYGQRNSVMMSRRWLRSAGAREYTSLYDEVGPASAASSQQQKQQKTPKTKVLPPRAIVAPEQSSNSCLPFVGSNQSLLIRNSNSIDDELDVRDIVDDEDDKFAIENKSRSLPVDVLSEDDDDQAVEYKVSYFSRNTRASRTKDKNHKIPPDEHVSKSSRIDIMRSFETQDTQTEDISETSLSTTLSVDDEDLDSYHTRSSSNLTTKRMVRFADEEDEMNDDSNDSNSSSNKTKRVPLAIVHQLDYQEPVTCRIVVLLLMNEGKKAPAESNFEFLHCEFLQDERHRVSHALDQLTQLVNKEPQTRPFTTLFYEGKELINAFSLQDYHLEDGKSILVAIRDGPLTTPKLLRQAIRLLSDLALVGELRKARIAARSLQTLYNSQEWQGARGEHRDPLLKNGDDEEDEDSDGDNGPFSKFDVSSLRSLEDLDFGGSAFGFNDNDEHLKWTGDDIFEGTGMLPLQEDCPFVKTTSFDSASFEFEESEFDGDSIKVHGFQSTTTDDIFPFEVDTSPFDDIPFTDDEEDEDLRFKTDFCTVVRLSL